VNLYRTARAKREIVAESEHGSVVAGRRRLPEFVKFDMSLVREIDKRATKQRLVAAIAAMCKGLGTRVVAEGVETEAERRTLIELGCELLQGHLFAYPGPAFPEPNRHHGGAA
jgi:EAL domain-containing protein (putative c-di-GMP-specific phosphodiesterase class I)